MNHFESDKYNSPFAVRFRELCKDTATAAKLRQYLGVTSQTISQFKLGTTLPKTENLIRIADFFNVSVDYLLGRTNTASQDVTIQAVCSTTGLSQAAVEKLSAHKIKKSITSQIIESKEFWDIIQSIQSALINYDTLAPSGKILADTAAGQMGIKVNWNDGKTTDLSKLPTEYLKYLGVVATEGATPIYKHLLTESISKLFDRIIEQNKKEV